MRWRSLLFSGACRHQPTAPTPKEGPVPTRKKPEIALPVPDSTEAAPGITNLSIAQTMQDIAGLLELKGENRFKIQAYERAADTLINLPEDIRQVWREGRLADIPNVGVAIASKI